ncbi:MAG: GNAT family N-acetyltransferase [Spirochaetales bacterium]|nr:GNAT family N-acetyltransferase [Spirochaetales bacterium]
MKIKGKRICLREYTQYDFTGFYKLVSDPLIRRLSLLRTPKTEKEAFLEFENIIADRKRQDRKRFIWGIFLLDEDVYIGDAGFEIIKHNETGGIAEIGYFLDKSYWGKGYATETASLLIEYCFTKMNIHKVVASCDMRNTPSEKVMIKCGMKKEGEFRQNRYKDNERHDELKYGILKKEWRERRDEE